MAGKNIQQHVKLTLLNGLKIDREKQAGCREIDLQNLTQKVETRWKPSN